MFRLPCHRFTSVSMLILLLASIQAHAAFFDSRSHKWEMFLAPRFTNSKELEFQGGSKADINEHSGLGFGFGYNFDRNIELGILFSSSQANYTSTLVPEADPTNPKKITANMYTSSIDMGLTYNLLRGPLTPYISANLGSTFIDSGIPTGNITTGCWWDPWYGYICAPVAQTYTATKLNYGASAGLRYDFNRKAFIKGGISRNYLRVDSSNTPDFTTYQLIFGLML